MSTRKFVPADKFLRIVLSQGAYSRNRNKFTKPVTCSTIAVATGMKPGSCYSKYRSIVKRVKKSSNGSLKLPRLPLSNNPRGRKPLDDSKLIEIVMEY